MPTGWVCLSLQGLDLVGTIHVPRKLRDLTKQLPSPRYESDLTSRSSSTVNAPPWNAEGALLARDPLPVGEQQELKKPRQIMSSGLGNTSQSQGVQ